MSSNAFTLRLPCASRGIKKYLKRKVTFLFEMEPWFELCNVYGIEISELKDLPMDKLLYGMAYASARWGDICAGYKPKVTLELAKYWLDNLPSRQLQEFSNRLLSSRVLNKRLVEYNDEVDEKKK